MANKNLLLSILAFLCIIPCVSFSQVLQLISSGGTFFENNDFSVCWSIGEPICETSFATGSTLTQGFQQSRLFSTSIDNKEHIAFDVKLFPNPAYDDISMFFSVLKPYSVELYSLLGVKVFSGVVDNLSFFINLEDLSSGSYFLLIYENDNVIYKNRIVKLN